MTKKTSIARALSVAIILAPIATFAAGAAQGANHSSTANEALVEVIDVTLPHVLFAQGNTLTTIKDIGPDKSIAFVVFDATVRSNDEHSPYHYKVLPTLMFPGQSYGDTFSVENNRLVMSTTAHPAPFMHTVRPFTGTVHVHAVVVYREKQ